jgi:hypothetical protein
MFFSEHSPPRDIPRQARIIHPRSGHHSANESQPYIYIYMGGCRWYLTGHVGGEIIHLFVRPSPPPAELIASTENDHKRYSSPAHRAKPSAARPGRPVPKGAEPNQAKPSRMEPSRAGSSSSGTELSQPSREKSSRAGPRRAWPSPADAMQSKHISPWPGGLGVGGEGWLILSWGGGYGVQALAA